MHHGSAERVMRGRARLLAASVALLAVVAACSAEEKVTVPTTTSGGSVAAGTPDAPEIAPCGGPTGVGAPVPEGLRPGDLVEAVDLTGANASSPGFPTGARVWRMLYVSTGVDETDLQLVCGLVAAPESGPRAFGAGGRLLNWTHGTVGLAPSCLPSSNPASQFWGKMAAGINAIAWGNLAGAHEGDPSGGLLQYAMDQGMVVTATDYQPDDTYVVGRIAAADALDAARAGSQLMDQEFDGAPGEYDMFVWGHSQGGHAALWAGQLAEPYYAAITPSRPTAALRLVGVAALAPASNFITLPGQPGVAPGDGLADWEMHQNVGLDLPDPSLQVQIGPALFSYIFGSWSQLSSGRQPAPDAAFPAFPAASAPLDMRAVVTERGAETVQTVQPLCLTGDQAKEVMAATRPYYDAATNQMLIPPIWNLPASGYRPGTYFRGGLDATCASSTDAAVTDWCAWMTWNLPGPLGTNPFPKVPEVGGAPVPLLIAQGTDDTIIHCVAGGGTGERAVPGPADCMSSALFDALASEVYCPPGRPVGHLQLAAYRKIEFQSPASHFSIPGQISSRGQTKAKSDLVFEGSPLQQFMDQAFEGNLVAGCASRVMNP